MEPAHEDHPALKRQRLAAYRKALLAAFKPYQELAIDNYAGAEQAAPDIWDLFVHPACSENHLRPEEMDAAQRERPPRLPAADLMPLLARDDYRRTVLLGDPGMGKSTLIQSLIAHLASGRPFVGAAALTGLLPVPLILRDLVPLLPQDKMETWTWDSLLTTLIEHYQRDEASPALCDCFKDHRDEFRHHLHTHKAVFFLIDGLDEIGDLAKRRKIVHCIQDGIRVVNKEARWLITSRVIGYENAAVDEAFWDHREEEELKKLASTGRPISVGKVESLWRRYATRWADYALPVRRGHYLIGAGAIPLGTPLGESWHLHPNNAPKLLAGEDRLPIAQRVYLAPFDDQRQDWFTQRWFQHRHSTDYSKELMREVRAHHHDGVRIISRVPNLLCMMNVLKRSGKPLPNGRAELYDMIVQAYLGGIDSAYRLRPVLGNTCPFDPPQRRFLLSLLGAHMQQRRVAGREGQSAEGEEDEDAKDQQAEGTILISKGEIAELLVPTIERMVPEKRVSSTHNAAALLDELLHHIASRSGLLIPRSSDAQGQTLFGFTHLSFLEFFAAEWLGMEFDRQRNRFARESEARIDGQSLSPETLDVEFPPRGPVQHARGDFEHLPGLPAWHEPIIFLLETRKNDTPTLLRWLFPALHANAAQLETWSLKLEAPWLPIEAVQLSVKLAQDPEVPIPPATRQSWWRILWSARLQWHHDYWDGFAANLWHIAPHLLARQETQQEILEALIAVWPIRRPIGTEPPTTRLDLTNCTSLTSPALRGVSALQDLDVLLLSGCAELDDIQFVASLPRLRGLSLRNCTGLKGPTAFQGLIALGNLERLFLDNCTGLEDTCALSGLHQLERLDLNHCTELKGAAAFQGLFGLVGLKELYLDGCTGLDVETLQALRQALPASCAIWGPDGLEVKRTR
ncbi:MAG: NACHT domain-containing protein [Verrucomicrobiaceae bacterium]|nr:NACHT domain-containing protein [Verrucomicrobiaceae bacterium]